MTAKTLKSPEATTPKDFRKNPYLPTNPGKVKVKYRKVAIDMGNRSTKIAWTGSNIAKASFCEIETVIGKADPSSASKGVFEYQGGYYVFGKNANHSSACQYLVSNADSLNEGRKINEFSLFFQGVLTFITNLKKPEKVNAIAIVISTTAPTNRYEQITNEIESIETLKIDGQTYRYDIKVIRVVPEGWGVVRSGSTTAFADAKIVFSRGVLLDIGHGTMILNEFDATRYITDKCEGEILDQKKHPRGCVTVADDWIEGMSQINGTIGDRKILLEALARGSTKGTYRFTIDKETNQAMNRVLTNAIASQWDAMMETVGRAIERVKLDGGKLYACGGGAELFRSQLKNEGFKVVPNPKVANAIGMLNWLKVQTVGE